MSDHLLEVPVNTQLLILLNLGDQVEHIRVNLFEVDFDVLCPMQPPQEYSCDSGPPDHDVGDLLDEHSGTVTQDRSRACLEHHSLVEGEVSLCELLLDAGVKFIFDLLLPQLVLCRAGHIN